MYRFHPGLIQDLSYDGTGFLQHETLSFTQRFSSERKNLLSKRLDKTVFWSFSWSEKHYADHHLFL